MFNGLKARCHTRFQRAFTPCCCVFKEITLFGSNQRNYFETANACKTNVENACRNSANENGSRSLIAWIFNSGDSGLQNYVRAWISLSNFIIWTPLLCRIKYWLFSMLCVYHYSKFLFESIILQSFRCHDSINPFQGSQHNYWRIYNIKFDLQLSENLLNVPDCEDIPFVALNSKYLEIFDILTNFFLTNYFAFFLLLCKFLKVRIACWI